MDSIALILTALVAFPALVMLGIWLFRRPSRVLGAYFAVLPFGSVFSLPIGLPRSFSTVSSLLGVAAGAAYLWHWLTKRPKLSVPSLSVPLWILYGGVAVATVAWSIRPGVTVGSLQVLGVLIALFVVVALTPVSAAEMAEVRGWIVAGAGLTGLYALLLAATGSLPTTGAGVSRFEITGAGGGTGGDPNITAAAMVVPIAIALSQLFDPERPRRSRVLYGLSAVLSGIAVLLTASRGGMLAVLLVGLVTIFSHRQGFGSLVLIALAVLPAALLVPSTFEERLDNTGTTGRTAIWRLAIESCPEYCPAGSGFGTFGDVHEIAFLTSESATGTNIRYQAHSIWFESLIEVGLTGLLLLVAAIGVLFRDLIRLTVHQRAGALAGLVGLVFANTFLSNLTFKYFWLGLTYGVMVVAVARFERESAPVTLPPLASSAY